MSGCSYECLIYPGPQHIEFVPSVAQLENVIRALVATGWLEASSRGWRGVTVEDSGSFKKVPLQLDTLRSGLKDLALASTYTVEINNKRDPGDPTPFEEDPEGVFRPLHCEDAYVFVSSLALAVEDSEGTAESACPACSRNVLLSRRDHPDPALRKAFLMPHFYGPERCPHCEAALDHRELSISLTTVVDTQRPRTEVAPFFRFGLWLLAFEKRYPQTDRIVLDPGILSCLQDVCGVPFRSVGRLSCS